MMRSGQGNDRVRIQRRPHASTARAQVYDVLRERIVALRLPPAAQLSDVEVAAELGVSKTPVREAILRLADEGLIDIVPQTGTFIARISKDEVREAQFIRETLEIAALRRAARRLTDSDYRALEANLAAQLDAAGEPSPDRFYTLDEAFHRLLLAGSGFTGLWRVADRSRAHLNRVRWLSLPDQALIAELLSHHQAIVEAMRRRDVTRAVAQLRQHLRLVLRDLDDLARRHPAYFAEERTRP